MKRTANTLSNSKLIRNLKPRFYTASWSTSYVHEHAFPIMQEHFNNKEEYDVAWDKLQQLRTVTSSPDPRIRLLMRDVHLTLHDALREEFRVN